MDVSVSIPEELISTFSTPDDISRQVLEAYAIENYRKKLISLGRLAELLELSIDQAGSLLNERKVLQSYDAADFEEDFRTTELFLKK